MNGLTMPALPIQTDLQHAKTAQSAVPATEPHPGGCPLLLGPGEPAEENAITPLRVVIAYDRPAAAQRALDLIGRMVREFQGEVALDPKVWRLAMFGHPDFRTEMLADSVAADVILVATRDHPEVNGFRDAWLDECVARRDFPTTVIMLLDARDARIATLDKEAVKARRESNSDFAVHAFDPMPSDPQRLGECA